MKKPTTYTSTVSDPEQTPEQIHEGMIKSLTKCSEALTNTTTNPVGSIVNLGGDRYFVDLALQRECTFDVMKPMKMERPK